MSDCWPLVVIIALQAVVSNGLLFFLNRHLAAERMAHQAHVNELLNRVQSPTPMDYEAWKYVTTPQPPPPTPEPLLYDETGLLSVPYQDSLED